MSVMSTRTVLFLVIFFVFAFVSEQAPSKRSTEDGSGELPPVVDRNDKNLRKVDSVLANENVFRDAGFNGRPTPPDYEYKSPADSEYDNNFDKPGKSNEISPDFDMDERPFGDRGVHDEDNGIHKSEEDEESGIDKKGHGDYDEEQEGETDHSFDDKNSKIPIDEDDDESRDDDRDFVDTPKDYDDEDDKSDDVPEDNSRADDFFGGFLFNSPLFNVRQVTKYFQQLEKALEHVFRETMDEAMLLNGTYANTTEEEVEINGKKYVVQKSIIKGRDNNSSIYVEALSTVPKTNRTLKVKDSGL